jgi:NAD(P)-dependent dehydrogenase (short-subunit alcohol dehydrogenase family)
MRWNSVAITGASSGLGRALALACAAPGVTLHLAGRDAPRLGETAAACRAKGAEVRGAALEVTDAAASAAWIAACGKLDLVIANAGIGGGPGEGGEPAEQVRRLFAVNLDGALNTALPAIAAMRAQLPDAEGVRGRIAVIASMAAFIASPGAPAYCASKAALLAWAEATDGVARRQGVRLHAVCPGYIRTPMTAQNPFPMPLLMSPERAAERTLRGIAEGDTRVVFPRRLYALARLTAALPVGWRNALLGRFPAKPRLG